MTNLYVSKLSALLMPLLMIIIYLAQLVIYYIGGNSIIEAAKDVLKLPEMIKIGEISQAVTYISMICMSIMMLGMTFTNLAKAFASSKRVNEILDAKLEIESSDSTGEKGILGEVEFKNVTFKYPKANAPVLKDISFKISRGETIAIVGSTGCGKSSLVSLIPRFYDATEGSVLVDGVDIKNYNLEVLREKISICLQKSELFSGTIADNVKFGYLNATNEEVDEACEIAQASEFINKTENGINTHVEEKGTSLSGGQKQRICIARAILRKPEILIFDDSTSALDLVTEAKLYNMMNKKLPNTTKIVVAQRIATVKNASKIIVIDDGKIVDFNSHEVLLKTCPIYQDIYKSQLKMEDKIYE